MARPGEGGEPRFEPQASVVAEILSFFGHVFGAVSSGRKIWAMLRHGEPGDRKAAGAGLLGFSVAISSFGLRASGALGGPVFLFVLVAIAFQLPWMVIALSAVRDDSERRRRIHELKRQEARLAERMEKTRERRHAWARSIKASLPMLGKDPRALATMGEATSHFESHTDYPLALALLRRKPGGRWKVISTRGEIADCLKIGTRLEGGLGVHEYIERHSPYPNHLIEEETVAGTEYHLVALAEIDILGEGKLAVLECFLDLIDPGLAKARADRN
jgi:hypothetical protein